MICTKKKKVIINNKNDLRFYWKWFGINWPLMLWPSQIDGLCKPNVFFWKRYFIYAYVVNITTIKRLISICSFLLFRIENRAQNIRFFSQWNYIYLHTRYIHTLFWRLPDYRKENTSTVTVPTWGRSYDFKLFLPKPWRKKLAFWL